MTFLFYQGLSLNYLPAHIVAKKLGITPNLLSRITGSLLIQQGSSKEWVHMLHMFNDTVQNLPPVHMKLLRRRRGLFLFRERSLLFLTVDATIGNQAFIGDRCNIFPGLIYNKENNM